MSVLVTSSSDPMGALAAKPKYERQATTSSLDTGMAIKFRVVCLFSADWATTERAL